MASVYILYSEKLDRFYTGSCNELTFRIGQHINKEYFKSFTAKTDDWILHCNTDEIEYKQARKIEEHIKRMSIKHPDLKHQQIRDVSSR